MINNNMDCFEYKTKFRLFSLNDRPQSIIAELPQCIRQLPPFITGQITSEVLQPITQVSIVRNISFEENSLS